DFDIPIIHKLYKFYLDLHKQTLLFPKPDRYTLGQTCERITLEILESLFLANNELNHSKIPALKRADLKLKILKITIRLCYDVKAINLKSYLILESLLQEIQKMLGGWISWLKRNSTL
ncbi:MAG TPA: four helix bundle protein, partial [Candidatus Paceibacterota bacterium]